MNKKTDGLIEYITTFDAVLQNCKSDKSFFLELARFMRDISRQNEFRNVIEIFNEDRNQLQSMLSDAETELDSLMESNFKKISSHKDFPKNKPEIINIIDKLDERKNGVYLTTEPMAETKYILLLKCIEALDINEYTHIIKDFKYLQDSEIKYKIYYDYLKYELIKQDYTFQSEASMWHSYDKLMLLPLCLYDYKELYEVERLQEYRIKHPNIFWWYLNAQGIHLEFKNIIKGSSDHPIEFKRPDYYFHYKKVSNFLISVLKGFITISEKYDTRATNITVEGLFNINTKDRKIQYIGINRPEGFTFSPTQRTQSYVLIVELARADEYKLTFDRIKKYLNDPRSCDRVQKKGYFSDDAQIMKSLVGRTIESMSMSADELKINEGQKLVYLKPQLNKKRNLKNLNSK